MKGNNNFVKLLFYYIVCVLCVTACWIGLEYIMEGSVHSSDADGIIAIILSWFIVDKYI